MLTLPDARAETSLPVTRPGFLRTALRRVAGRALPAHLEPGAVAIDRWSGYPPLREQYWRSRAELPQRVEALVRALVPADQTR
jgi:hypothetical protein